jgi:dihydroxyacetone kinase-like predicted kinase
MSVQHTESNNEPEQCDCEQCVEMRASLEKKKIAVVAVASGEGLVNLFKSMGVDYVVHGGQTMNPSAEDFVTAFDSLNAENILVFPNNGNIVMAAKQAGKYYEKANIVVVNSKSLAQGYSALTMFDSSMDDVEEIVSELEDVISNVTTAEVTYSIRDANIDGVDIKKGDYIGIVNKKMIASTCDKVQTVKEILNATDLSEKEIITIIKGKEATDEEVEAVVEFINESYPDIETDVVDGSQDVYSFILSIE